MWQYYPGFVSLFAHVLSDPSPNPRIRVASQCYHLLHGPGHSSSSSCSTSTQLDTKKKQGNATAIVYCKQVSSPKGVLLKQLNHQNE